MLVVIELKWHLYIYIYKKKKLTCVRSLLRILVLLLVTDVFVGHEEQNHFTLFILNGYDVQKTPEL